MVIYFLVHEIFLSSLIFSSIFDNNVTEIFFHVRYFNLDKYNLNKAKQVIKLSAGFELFSSLVLSRVDSEIENFKDITTEYDKFSLSRRYEHSMQKDIEAFTFIDQQNNDCGCMSSFTDLHDNSKHFTFFFSLWCLWPTQQVTTKSIAISSMNDFFCANFQTSTHHFITFKVDKLWIHSHNYDYVTCHMFLTFFYLFLCFLLLFCMLKRFLCRWNRDNISISLVFSRWSKEYLWHMHESWIT